ncbi:hypothetical protein NFI96_026760 [Prochilodus magdalenae]|nr:hypothetical protein NFI96_026760 [Prochilodus magdalenae]
MLSDFSMSARFVWLFQTGMASRPSIIPLLLPEDELMCSICQWLLKDPVTIPCGHNFCMDCIKRHWGKIASAFYCPQCRRKFVCKPNLQPNTVLCSIMEHVVKVWAEPEPCLTSVEKRANCDVCHESRKLPAAKTCVTCLASFCSMHLMPHTESQALKKHCLCAPVMDIKELQCKKHGKVLEMFCMTHKVTLCWQCLARHRKCNMRPVEEMRKEWKASVDPVAEEAQNRNDATDEALEALDTLSEGVKVAAEKMKEDVELCFKALRDTIEHAQDRVITFIEAEKEGALQRTEEQERRLDDHMLAVSRVLEQINECRSNDSFFNFCLPLPQLPPEVSRLHGSDVQLDGRALERIILDLQKLNSSLESHLCATLTRREELRDKDLAQDDFKVVSGHSKRRHKLLKYSCGVTFDPMTASASVLLSEDSLAVTVEHSGLLTWKDYQANMEMGFRVLCSQNFTRGQHYWEVCPPKDLKSNWAVGVTYKNGQERYQSLGRDESSWCVRWQNAGKIERKDENSERIEEAGGEEAISNRIQTKERATGAIGEGRGPKLESKQDNVEAHPNKSEGQNLEGHKHRREANKAYLFDGIGGTSIRVTEKIADGGSEVTEENERIVTATQEEEDKGVTGFFASHKQEMHLISQDPPGKIGVHLDCDRGWLSFFTVSDSKVKLCYKFQALLSAPLHPAVWIRDPEKTMAISKGLYPADSCG